jgi:hypothetical protein
MSEDAFERLARRRASGEITDVEYGRQLDRLIVLQERVRFFRSVAGCKASFVGLGDATILVGSNPSRGLPVARQVS